MPRCSLSNTDRDAPSGLSQTCWGKCPAAGLWIPVLKINNLNCMLQDVFNLSLGFGYSCILSLSGKSGICQRGITSVAFFFFLVFFLFFFFIHLNNFDVPVDNFPLLLFYYPICLLFSIIFLYPLLFHFLWKVFVCSAWCFSSNKKSSIISCESKDEFFASKDEKSC